MMKYGSWEGAGWGTGIAPSQPPRSRTTPGTPLPLPAHAVRSTRGVPEVKYGRGALIGRPTLFMDPFLRVPRYDRGL